MNERISPSNPEEKKPHFISARLLKALGGFKIQTEVGDLVTDDGAYLWGVSDREKGFGLFKHILLVSRVAYNLARALKNKHPERYEELDLQSVVEVALLHDVAKLYAQDREDLTPDKKISLGLPPEFTEISDKAESVGVGILSKLGFPDHVSTAIVDHFPLEVKDDPYWKIGLVSDYMVGQNITTVQNRIDDVRNRWVTQRVARGQKPKIPAEHFEKAALIIQAVAEELFRELETTDSEFISINNLNDPDSTERWERFLMKTRNSETEESALRHVNNLIG